jgi:hypothetical protein
VSRIKAAIRRRMGVSDLESKLATAKAQRAEARSALAELRARHKEQGRSLRVARARLKRAQADIDGLYGLVANTTELSPEVSRVLLHVTAHRLTMIRVPELIEMCAVVADVQARGVEGSFLETGAAMGGSAILLTALKEPDRELAVHDVFGQIPPPTAEDGEDVHQRYATIVSGKAKGPGGSDYYGYQTDLLSRVTAAFADAGYPVDDHRVRLVQGLFEETLHPAGPIAFAHLDGDWYESTMVALQRVVPHLSVGGVLMVDDYHSWSGCARAVDEFFAERADFEWVEDGTRLRLVRTSPQD